MLQHLDDGNNKWPKHVAVQKLAMYSSWQLPPCRGLHCYGRLYVFRLPWWQNSKMSSQIDNKQSLKHQLVITWRLSALKDFTELRLAYCTLYLCSSRSSKAL